MSMSLYVMLTAEHNPSSKDLNTAAITQQIPIEYTTNISLKKHNGYLPVKLQEFDTGVEVHTVPTSDAPLLLTKTDMTHEQGIIYQLRWSGDFKEGAAAFYTAITLSTHYKGIAFDPESGIKLDTEQLTQGAETFFNLRQ